MQVEGVGVARVDDAIRVMVERRVFRSMMEGE